MLKTVSTEEFYKAVHAQTAGGVTEASPGFQASTYLCKGVLVCEY